MISQCCARFWGAWVYVISHTIRSFVFAIPCIAYAYACVCVPLQAQDLQGQLSRNKEELQALRDELTRQQQEQSREAEVARAEVQQRAQQELQSREAEVARLARQLEEERDRAGEQQQRAREAEAKVRLCWHQVSSSNILFEVGASRVKQSVALTWRMPG